jgi:hypothetical protein
MNIRTKRGLGPIESYNFMAVSLVGGFARLCDDRFVLARDNARCKARPRAESRAPFSRILKFW